MPALLFTLAFILCFSFAFAQEEGVYQHQDSTAYSMPGLAEANDLIQSYQFNKAILKLDEYLREYPADTDALHKLAACHYNLGNLSKAKTKFQEILQIDSNDVVASNRLGTLFMKEKAYKQAKLCFQQLIRNDSTNSYYYKKLAEIEGKLGAIDQSIKLYHTALTYNPDDLESITALSGIYLELVVDSPAMKKKYYETLYRGLQLDSLNRSLLEIKARYAFKTKNYQETVTTLDLIFTHHADTLHYYAGLAGICQMNLGNLEIAEQWFQYIIDKGDDTELTHYYMGLTYDKMEEHDKAAAHFTKAIEKGISENMFNYYVSLAESYEKTNQLDASIRAYQEAYQYNRQDILLYKLARNYDTYYEDKRTAIRYYQKFLDQSNANTDNPYATYANQRINELSEYLHVIDTLN